MSKSDFLLGLLRKTILSIFEMLFQVTQISDTVLVYIRLNSINRKSSTALVPNAGSLVPPVISMLPTYIVIR